LGIVFYELLTGRRPFVGSNSMDTMVVICQGNPVPPSKVVRGIPSEVDAVVLKMLASDKEQRYADGAELFATLNKLTRQLDGDAAALQECVTSAMRSPANELNAAAILPKHDAFELDTLERALTIGLVESRSDVVPTDVGAVVLRDPAASYPTRAPRAFPPTRNRRSRTLGGLAATLGVAAAAAFMSLWGSLPWQNRADATVPVAPEPVAARPAGAIAPAAAIAGKDSNEAGGLHFGSARPDGVDACLTQASSPSSRDPGGHPCADALARARPLRRGPDHMKAVGRENDVALEALDDLGAHPRKEARLHRSE
jgi:serine/threonine-protein kinase